MTTVTTLKPTMLGNTHVEAVFAIFTEADNSDYKFADQLLAQGIGCREDARDLVKQWCAIAYPDSVQRDDNGNPKLDKNGAPRIMQNSAGIQAITRVLNKCFPLPKKIKAEPSEAVKIEESEAEPSDADSRNKADKVFKLLVEFEKLSKAEQTRFMTALKLDV